ncbi:MAG: hypothetical protein AAFO87_15575, partial [Cyanobacteria bacterium J06607_6]
VNLRDRLFELTLADQSLVSWLPAHWQGNKADSSVVMRYVGSCRNDGTLLRPEHVTFMFEQQASCPLSLLHAHRLQLILNPELPD